MAKGKEKKKEKKKPKASLAGPKMMLSPEPKGKY